MPRALAITGAMLGGWAGLGAAPALVRWIAPWLRPAEALPSAVSLSAYPKDQELARLAIVLGCGLAGACLGGWLGTRVPRRREHGVELAALAGSMILAAALLLRWSAG